MAGTLPPKIGYGNKGWISKKPHQEIDAPSIQSIPTYQTANIMPIREKKRRFFQ
jgi:hypothetical protein